MESPVKRILTIVGIILLVVGIMVVHQLGQKPITHENKEPKENTPFIGPVWTPPENKPIPPKDLIPVRMQKRDPGISLPSPDGTTLFLAFDAQNIYDYPIWIEDMELVWRVRGKDTQIPGTREIAVTSVVGKEVHKHAFQQDMPSLTGTVIRFVKPIIIPAQTNLLIQVWGRKDEGLKAFIQQNGAGVHFIISHMRLGSEERRRLFASVLSLMSDPIY